MEAKGRLSLQNAIPVKAKPAITGPERRRRRRHGVIFERCRARAARSNHIRKGSNLNRSQSSILKAIRAEKALVLIFPICHQAVLQHYLLPSDSYVSRSVVPGPGNEWALLAKVPQARSNYALTQGLRPKSLFNLDLNI